MITTVWPYLTAMLLAAGLFPAIERGYPARLFQVLPPIVLTYLFVTALAVAGLFRSTDEIRTAQRALTAQLLPALLFLFMATCDLRAVLALGPRVLATFGCAMATILLSIVLTYLAFRGVLPADGWKMLAALSATWTGGSANLIAVKQAVGLSESALPAVLLADALCYSVWVVVLFSSAGFAPAFDRFTRAGRRAAPAVSAPPAARPAEPGTSLLWLGLASGVGLGSAKLAAAVPPSAFFTPSSWTSLFATAAGLAVARTPLARLPGPAPLASALLACLVAVLASQGDFAGLATAPVFVLCGFVVLSLHVALMVVAARLFKFDLHLCGIASLAQIGGPASAPLLAAAYSRVLVPVAVLLAMLGLVSGTGVGLLMARLLSALAPVPPP
jgi:uncharacterized membrane protein